MHKIVAAGLAPLLFVLFWMAAQAAGPFGTRWTLTAAPPPTPKIMVQPCVNNRGGFGTLAPCTASVAAVTTSALTTTSTTVFRFQPNANSPTPPAGQTKIVASLFIPSAGVTMNNACVCSGSVGASAWNCATGATVQRITCGGGNSCALGTGSGVTLDPVTFPWNTTMMMFALDFSAVGAGWNKAGVSTNNTAGSINYSTTGGGGGSNSGTTSFNTWSKASVQEACAAANSRTASYSTNGTNGIFGVSKLVAQ